MCLLSSAGAGGMPEQLKHVLFLQQRTWVQFPDPTWTLTTVCTSSARAPGASADLLRRLWAHPWCTSDKVFIHLELNQLYLFLKRMILLQFFYVAHEDNIYLSSVGSCEDQRSNAFKTCKFRLVSSLSTGCSVGTGCCEVVASIPFLAPHRGDWLCAALPLAEEEGFQCLQLICHVAAGKWWEVDL